jgi:hypothetical protein
VEADESAIPQRFVEEARLVGPAMVVEFPLAEQSWTPQSQHNTTEGILDGILVPCWAKHAHHHLLEHAQESLVMPTQHSFRKIPKHLYTLFLLLKSCGVSLS